MSRIKSLYGYFSCNVILFISSVIYLQTHGQEKILLFYIISGSPNEKKKKTPPQ